MELDPTYLILMLSRGEGINNIIFIIMGIIFIKIMQYGSDNILDRINKYRNKKWNKIFFEGQETISDGWKFYSYPKPFLALCRHAYINDYSNRLKHFIMSKNSQYSWQTISKGDNSNNFILDECFNIEIDKDKKILLDVYADKGNQKVSKSDKTNDKPNTIYTGIMLCLKSKTYSMEYLRKFVDRCTREYDDYIKSNTGDKIYHFIFKGRSKHGDTLDFTSSVINDLGSKIQTCYESFEHIHNEHKEKIIDDINRLKHIDYYKKFGLKRKKGYLFHGYPGCGKTYTVMAMSNYDKRHIIEIPMSRIKTNRDLEDLLALTEIHGIKFERHQIILLFDEIDTGSAAINKKEEEKDIDKKVDKKELIELLVNKDTTSILKNSDDTLNLGTVLSRIDGIGNYDGIIIVATTNCREKLSPALYRHGRLDPIFYDYCRRVDIKNIIEEHLNIKLTEEQIKELPDREQKIAPSSIIKYIEDSKYKFDTLIDILKNAK
jgi:hypothetical protein